MDNNNTSTRDARSVDSGTGAKKDQKTKKKFPFKKVGIGLVTTLVVVVSLYMILAPMMPAAEFYLRDKFGIGYDYTITDVIKGDYNNDDESGEGDESGEDSLIGVNTVIIPKIGVKIDVVEGIGDKTLDEGAWLRPNTSNPRLGGNTVLTAHRFNYIGGEKTFYNLDKLENGDEIKVEWEGEVYTYHVNDSFIVDPSHVEIEANSDKAMLTLYTCTPLWTATNRLVVTAVPDEATLEMISK